MMTANGTPAAPQQAQPFSFVDRAYYEGEIIRQAMEEDRNGQPELALYVRLKGQLVDGRRPEAGLLPCPDVEVCARLQFPSDNPTKMGYAVNDLIALGFSSDDLAQLAPGHKKHASFVGKKVWVAPQHREYNGMRNTYWNLRFPRAREEKAFDHQSLSKSVFAQAFREAVKAAKDAPKAGAAKGGDKEVPF